MQELWITWKTNLQWSPVTENWNGGGGATDFLFSVVLCFLSERKTHGVPQKEQLYHERPAFLISKIIFILI